MTRASKERTRRRQRAGSPPPDRGFARSWLVLPAVLAAAVAIVILLRANGDDRSAAGREAGDPGPVHVHGLGVDPANGALFIATHTGLYRVDATSDKADRVGSSFQDTMGFTIVGSNRFLGSGHPDLRTDQPPLLGLIESTDAGETWESISLLGEAAFHVLRFAGERLYGYDASNDRLLASADRGRSWSELRKPGPIVDVAIDAGDRRRLAAATRDGLFESRDAGETWKRLNAARGLLAWPSRERLYVVDGGGQMFRSRDGGRRFERRGSIGGEPAALLGVDADELFVALHDGTIKHSTDGGATWTVRSTP